MPNYTAESICTIDLVGHGAAGKTSWLRYAVRTFSNNGNDVSLWIGVAAHLSVYGMLRHRY